MIVPAAWQSEMIPLFGVKLKKKKKSIQILFMYIYMVRIKNSKYDSNLWNFSLVLNFAAKKIKKNPKFVYFKCLNFYFGIFNVHANANVFVNKYLYISDVGLSSFSFLFADCGGFQSATVMRDDGWRL